MFENEVKIIGWNMYVPIIITVTILSVAIPKVLPKLGQQVLKMSCISISITQIHVHTYIWQAYVKRFFSSRENTKLDIIVAAFRGTYSLEDGWMCKGLTTC